MANATILVWNINSFTDNRIALGAKRRRSEDEDYGAAPPGPEHLNMILDTCFNNTNPMTANLQLVDFIVVVEVYNRRGVAVEGDLVDGSGLRGCIDLLAALQGRFPLLPISWALVPPVVTGDQDNREAIAVFYRADRWYFLGPESWPVSYPVHFTNGLPNPARIIPAGYPYRANLSEHGSAGQWQFLRPPPPLAVAPHAPINFPGNINRKPWLTAFGRIVVPPAVPTLLVRLMSIHTKPNDRRVGYPDYADDATRNLADVQEMTTHPPDAPNQIDVILGDFNVDNLDPANFQAAGPFGRLIGAAGAVNPTNPPYVPWLQPPAGLAAGNQSYYHTHGRPVGSAKIVDGRGLALGDYPGFSYTDESLDNALVRYHVAPLPAIPRRTTIVNRASGASYVPAILPGPAPQPGFYQNPTAMRDTIDHLIALGLQVRNEDANQDFRNAHNYGLVHRVSDHFALLFDI
jgi:hypothetical protein